MKQKDLWEKLAQKNAMYYINSDIGEGITELEFEETGRVSYEKLLKRDHLIPKGGVLLDIGCGIGRLEPFMSEEFKVVFGVDISKTMIEKAIERVGFLPNIALIETDGNFMPLNDETVDVAFSYLVFQHFKTMEMVKKNFKDVYRVLKKGGIFKVLVRSDKVRLTPWWGGVNCDEKAALESGFKLLKKRKVKNYGLWLWLQK